MNGIVHPYSKDLYERDDSQVQVTRANGTVGFYAADGRWLAGEKFEADRHLCGWIMSPRSAHRLSANTVSH